MRKSLIPTIALALLATGCATMTAEERRAADEETCRSYGFRQGTDAFASCLLQLELDRRAAMRQMMDSHHFHDPIVIYRPVPVSVRP